MTVPSGSNAHGWGGARPNSGPKPQTLSAHQVELMLKAAEKRAAETGKTIDEVLFGGAAGPGKTDCLVAAVAADIKHPRYRGLLVRRTYPQLQEIIDRCWRLYARMGATYRATEKRWAFPSGAVIDLGHMQHEDDKYNYQ